MLLKLNASAIVLGAFLLCCASSGHAQTTINLTSSQQAEIWRDLGKRATRTQEPAGLHVGEAVPDTMHVLSFARHVRKKIPALRPYSYVLLHGQVLIIDPRRRTIVSIVSK
jgi:uncharacterized protein DUF1236